VQVELDTQSYISQITKKITFTFTNLFHMGVPQSSEGEEFGLLAGF
jgi:hypothetical protein